MTRISHAVEVTAGGSWRTEPGVWTAAKTEALRPSTAQHEPHPMGRLTSASDLEWSSV